MAVLPDVLPRPAAQRREIFLFRVAHSLPGRVRIIVDSEDARSGLQLARRFAYHPSVSSVRWTVAARSLVVQFDSRTSLERILEELPDEDELPAPVTVAEDDRLALLRLGSLLIEVLSGNPIAIAQGLLSQLPARAKSIY